MPTSVLVINVCINDVVCKAANRYIRFMARPKLPEDQRMESISARVTKDMVAEIDDYLEGMKAETPLLILNRADAIRQLLAIALGTAAKDKNRAKRKPS